MNLKKEIDILEMLQNFETLSKKEQEMLNGYQEELQKVDGEWWLHKRAIWQIRPRETQRGISSASGIPRETRTRTNGGIVFAGQKVVYALWNPVY